MSDSEHSWLPRYGRTIRLYVDAVDNYFSNENMVTEEALLLQLKAASTQSPEPELHILGVKVNR